MLSLPLYGNPRRRDRPTTGAAVAVIADLLGYRLQPWQRYVADLAGEQVPNPDYDPDSPFYSPPTLNAYSLVTVSVGRRAGKSLLMLSAVLERIQRYDTAAPIPPQRTFAYYTAQNGRAAAERFRNDWTPLVAASPTLAPLCKPRLTNGTETLTQTTGPASLLKIFAPIPTSLHGDAGDLIVFDEAWAHTVERGAELEIAAKPLTATRPGAQVWIVSAAGNDESSWWNRYLEIGREAAAADRGRGHLHIEWSADSPDLDPADEATWIAAHPAIRTPENPTGTIALDFLRDEYALDPDQFRRTYLNITDRDGTTSSPFDVDTWNGLGTEVFDRSGLVTFGIDVAADHAAAAVVMAGEINGTPTVELADHRDGIGWVVERCSQLFDRYDVVRFVLDAYGPAGALVTELQAAGLPLTVARLNDTTAAAAQFTEAVRTGRVFHVPNPALDAAIRSARRRPVGDGSYAFGRRDAGDDVSPLIAATLARYVHPVLRNTSPAIA